MENEYQTEDIASVIGEIPEERPRGEDIDSVVSAIPEDITSLFAADMSLDRRTPNTTLTPDGVLTSWNSEQAQDEAAKALSYLTLTGKEDPSEIGPLMNLSFDDVPQDYSLLEAVKYHYENFKHSIKSNIDMLEAGKAYTQAMISGDPQAKQEALEAMKAASEPMEGSGDAPENVKSGWATDIAEGLGSIFGSLGYTYGQAGSEEAAIGAVIGGTGGTLIAGPIAGAAAAIGTGFVTTYGTAAVGVHAMSMIQQGVDPETAEKVAIVTGSLEALLEQLQMGTFAKAIPGLPAVFEGFTKKFLQKTLLGKLSQVAIGSAVTGVEETAVESMQNFAQELGANYARGITNELRENTNLEVKTIKRIGLETLEQAKHILPSMLVMGGMTHGVGVAGRTVGATAKTIVRRSAENQLIEDAAGQLRNLQEQETAVSTELRDIHGARVDPESATIGSTDNEVVVNEDGSIQAAVPITPVETVKQEHSFEESPIVDEEFDQVAQSGTEESIEEMVERDLTVAQEAGSYYGDFIARVREILPRKQAKAVDKILEARARATNRTKEQFAEDHRLVLRTGEGASGGAVEFIKDGETIIRAFQQTTLPDVLHELGHVFRKDLSDPELKAAEEVFEVRDGNWTTQQEEQFANGFTEYLTTGEAPTASLKGVFEKLRTWIGSVVTALKGEKIPLSPEVESFYASVFAEQMNPEYVYKAAQAKEATSQTLYAPGKKAPVRTGTKAAKAITEREAFKKELKKKAQEARDAWKSGYKEGYAKAKAEYKAMVRRARNRSAQIKSRSKMRDRVTKLVRDQKVKMQSGKPKGRFTAGFQENVDALIRIMSMPIAEAKALSRELNEEVLPEDYGTWQDKLERQLLDTRANMGHMDIEALNDLYDDLRAYFDYGQELRAQELADSMNRIQQAKADIRRSLRSTMERRGWDPDEVGGVYEDRVGDFRKAWDNILLSTIYDFNGLMERIDMGLRDVIGEGSARKFTELIDAQNAFHEGTRLKSEQIMRTAAGIYGFKDENGEPSIGLVRRYFWKEEQAGKREVLSFYETDKKGRPTGKLRRLNLTQAEIRNLWMELQDDSIAEMWSNLGLTEDHKKIILGQLSQKDQIFIKAQLDMYRSFYEEINEVYRYMYGTNLDRRKNYSPILRDLSKMDAMGGVDELLQQMRPMEYRGVGAASLKSRVSSDLVTQARSDIGKWNCYARQMEHFKAFAPKMREVNAVFRDKEVQRAIVSAYGKNFYITIDKLLGNIIKGGTSVDYELWYNRAARTVRANLARGLVGMKPLAMVKQLTSALAYTSDMPVSDFMDGIAEFLKNPKESMAWMKESSAFVRNRGETITRDIAALYRSSELGGLLEKKIPPSFNNVMMVFVKAGDVGAIYAGGYSYIRYWMKQGLSKEEAFHKFEILSRDTQQSAELTNLSLAQQGEEWMQLFTMFTTSPRQYIQRTMLALEAGMAGRMEPKDVAKTFVVYTVALPVLFQVASQVGSSDEDALRSYLKAVLTSPLRAIPVAGQIADYMGSVMVERTDYGTGVGNLPIFSPAQETIKGLKKLNKDDISYYDTLLALRQLVAVSEYAGVPGKQAMNVIIGMSDITGGEMEKGVLEISGASPYTAARKVGK